MGIHKVDFDSISWVHGCPGVRYKVLRQGSRQLRLVEFTASGSDPEWCEQGHIGYVLSGALNIESDGEVLHLKAGEGLFIPAGHAGAHRGLSIIPGTRLILVEDL